VNLTYGVLALRPIVTHCIKRMWVVYYFVGLLSLDHSDDSEWVEESKEGECGCGTDVGKCEVSLMQIISGLAAKGYCPRYTSLCLLLKKFNCQTC
jgi:hypothetical protein